MEKYKLAIETSIGWGSISLFQEKKYLGGLVLNKDTGKSEDLIWQIDWLLKEFCFEKQSLNEIIFSASDQSFAGARSKMAVIMGFANALQIRITKIDIIAKLFEKFSDKNALFIFPERNSNLTLISNIDANNNYETFSIDLVNLSCLPSKFENYKVFEIITISNSVGLIKRIIPTENITVLETNISCYLI